MIYLSKIMGYIWKKYGIYLENYGGYWAKIIIYILGYIGLKLLDIFGKTIEYTSPLDILIKINGIYKAKIMRYIKQKLWYIQWDIVVKRYGIYLTKNNGYIG